MHHAKPPSPLNYLERLFVQSSIYYWVHRLIDLPILLHWVKIPKTASILELGCGMGRMAHHLSRTLKCKSYTAIDIDPQMIAAADAKGGENPKLIFQVADISRLPFEDESFDVILEFDVLHHLHDWKKGVREIHRVLKKDGVFLMKDYSIETFNIPGLGFLFRQLFDHPYDFMFDQVELISTLRKNGFVIHHQIDNSLVVLLAASKKGLLKKKKEGSRK